ncbi:universal stress protein [bacterium]|nr:universal stress protein [bacterium]|tara:strand:+ start:1581 stop:1796 length:216 start_codon:yes stop_codon:yes gene_type:complete
MTPFPQPIELDAVLETTWEPIADMVKRRAEQVDAEMLIVAHHSKKWWEEALAGSVAKYLIDNSDLNVVVVH